MKIGLNKFNLGQNIYFVGRGDAIHRACISTITLIEGRVAYSFGERTSENQPLYRLEKVCFATFEEAKKNVGKLVAGFNKIDKITKEANETIKQEREILFGKQVNTSIFQKAVELDNNGKELLKEVLVDEDES